MAGLRVFVSSTCYDLSVIRSQLRVFIQNVGHEPIMSDYSDLLYDHRYHTHTNCVDEVSNADVVVLIVGSRFGGKTVPEALKNIDFEELTKESKSVDLLKEKENLSVTQLEILKAIECKIPVFTFIDNEVWHDHALYEKNKDKSIVKEIVFPSIEKADTAKYIFDFINFLRHRAKGNSVFSFSKVQDIEEILRKQWSALFQKLLHEQKERIQEARRIEVLTDQFEDLKTAILTSFGTSNEREVAKGVVRYRRLIDFIRALRMKNESIVYKGNPTWDDILGYAGIMKVIDISQLTDEFKLMHRNNYGRTRGIYLIKEDGTFFEYKPSIAIYYRIRDEFETFIKLPETTREVIYEALSDMNTEFLTLRHNNEPFEKYIDRISNRSELTEDLLKYNDSESDKYSIINVES